MTRTSGGTFMNLTHEDFLSRLRIERDGCWVYTGPCSRDGYGLFGRNRLAHKYAYAHWVGEMPDGCEIDHLCRIRSCCNPDHLQAVSHKANVLRGESPSARHARKTHCCHGHELTPGNIYLSKRGVRVCKKCQSDASRAYYARKTIERS